MMFKLSSFALLLISLTSWTIDGRSDVIKSPQLRLRDDYNNYKLVQLRTGAASAKTKAASKKLNQAYSLYKIQLRLPAQVSSAMSWATEEVSVSGHKILLTNLPDEFRSWVLGDAVPDAGDLAFNFPATADNDVEVLSGNEEFWPRLIDEVTNARSSIHVQMFGVTADPWVWDFARLLAQKASEGVKVRILADSLGARMLGPSTQKVLGFFVSDYQDQATGTEALFDYMTTHGVDVAYSPPRFNDGQMHVDHRKYYIIDGQTAYNTGFTWENDMRFKKFDEGLRLQGTVVRQIQLSFMANFLRAGGKISGKDWNSFLETYFPAVQSSGTTELALQVNIPDVREQITETYLDAIARSRHYVYLMAPYFASGQINVALEAAADRGVDVRVVVPRIPVDGYYEAEDRYIFDGFLKKKIKPYIYDGPQNLGLIHAKGLVSDGKIASVGSCNMDPFSLFFNSEQNITTHDKALVDEIEKRIFEKLFSYSKIYQEPATEGARARVDVSGAAVNALRGILELDE